MVKHIILWTLKSEYSAEEKEKIKKDIKNGLEGLYGKIDGLTDIKVYTCPLETSNVDLCLDSTFADFDALKGYAVHPDHVWVAKNLVVPFTAERRCIDFEI